MLAVGSQLRGGGLIVQVRFVKVDRVAAKTDVKYYIPARGNTGKRKILKYVNMFHVQPTGDTVHNFGH